MVIRLSIDMSDDMVKRICQTWIEYGLSDECFWEGWPECPTPEDSLTPRMVIDRIEELEANINLKADFIDATMNQLAASDQRIEELEAKLEKALGALEWVKFGGGPNGESYYELACQTLAELKGET